MYTYIRIRIFRRQRTDERGICDPSEYGGKPTRFGRRKRTRANNIFIYIKSLFGHARAWGEESVRKTRGGRARTETACACACTSAYAVIGTLSCALTCDARKRGKRKTTRRYPSAIVFTRFHRTRDDDGLWIRDLRLNFFGGFLTPNRTQTRNTYEIDTGKYNGTLEKSVATTKSSIIRLSFRYSNGARNTYNANSSMLISEMFISIPFVDNTTTRNSKWEYNRFDEILRVYVYRPLPSKQNAYYS